MILGHLFTSADEPLRKKKKNKKERELNFVSKIHISIFLFIKMEKICALKVFLTMELGGPEEFLQIENVKQIINVNQKNILFLFVLQMKLDIHKPLCTVESRFKTTCCLPMI